MGSKDKKFIFAFLLIFSSFIISHNNCKKGENKIDYNEKLNIIDPGIRVKVKRNIQLLKNENWKVRLSAVSFLSQMGPMAQEAVPALTGALNESNIEIKKMVIMALGNIGHEAKIALRSLKKIQEDKAVDILVSVKNSIKLIEHDNIIDRCIKQLSNSDRSTWLQALFDLGELAPDINKAIPILIKKTNDTDNKIRALAIRVLGIVGIFNISDNSVGNIINKAAEDKDENVRTEANIILGNYYHHTEAIKLVEDGKLDSAIVHFFNALNSNPKDVSACLALKTIYQAKGEYDSSLVFLSKIISFYPREPVYYLHRAGVYWEGNKIEKSFLDINRALYLGSKDISLYILRCMIYLSKNNNDLALQDINQALNIDSKNILSYTERALIYYNTKNYNLALVDLRKAIELNIQKSQPAYSRSYLYLFKTLEKLGKKEEALLACRIYNQTPQPSLESIFVKGVAKEMEEVRKRMEDKKK